MDTNDRYTALCEDLRSLMRQIRYSVPCEPEEILGVLVYDIAALRPWFPRTAEQVEAVRSLLTSLDRRVFLVNDGNRHMTLYLDAMYTREIRQLYRFSAVQAETGTLWKRTLRADSAACTEAARRWLKDLAEFMDSFNEDLDQLEAQLPEEVLPASARGSEDPAVKDLRDQILATLA